MTAVSVNTEFFRKSTETHEKSWYTMLMLLLLISKTNLD